MGQIAIAPPNSFDRHVLTERESQVLSLLMAGLSSKEIANDLNCAVKTVWVHRSHVYEKMGVHSLIDLFFKLKMHPEIQVKRNDSAAKFELRLAAVEKKVDYIVRLLERKVL